MLCFNRGTQIVVEAIPVQVIQLIDYRDVLMKEIALLKSRYEPQDTGHLRTTVSVLEDRLVELKEQIGMMDYGGRN